MVRPLERHLSLIQVLLSQRRPVSKEFIRSKIEEYAATYENNASEEAFNKMFERDKKSLLKLGVPIETRATDVLSDVEDGYIIDREKFFLPRISLTPREQQLLVQASEVWAEGAIRKYANRAVHSVLDTILESAQEVDTHVTLGASAFGVSQILEAIAYHRQVAFSYRSSANTDAHERTLDPWRLFVYRGSWYVVGFCHQHTEPYRIYRLNRIHGDVQVLDAPIVNQEPDDFSINDVIQEWGIASGGSAYARLSVSKNSAGVLRRFAESVEEGATQDHLTIAYSSEKVLAHIIAEIADQVVVHEPTSLQNAVSDMLIATLEVNAP